VCLVGFSVISYLPLHRRLHVIWMMVRIELGRPRLGMPEIAADLAYGYAALRHPCAGCMAQGVARAVGNSGPLGGFVERGFDRLDSLAMKGDYIGR
jgi:hypothetical protein